MELFVSYRRANWSFTYWLVEELRNFLDCDIFVDFTGIDESNFEQAILHHLHECAAVLLIVSAETFDAERISHDNDWLRREIREALNANKPISMAFHDGETPPAAEILPEDIREITKRQGIPFYSHYFKAGVLQLAEFIARSTPIPIKHRLSSTLEPPSATSNTLESTTNAAQYAQAIAFFEAGQYEKALQILEGLKAIGYQVFSAKLDEVIRDVRERQAQEESRWQAGKAYDQIEATLRLNKQRAYEMWQAFQREYGEVFRDDPADIRKVFLEMERAAKEEADRQAKIKADKEEQEKAERRERQKHEREAKKQIAQQKAEQSLKATSEAKTDASSPAPVKPVTPPKASATSPKKSSLESLIKQDEARSGTPSASGLPPQIKKILDDPIPYIPPYSPRRYTPPVIINKNNPLTTFTSAIGVIVLVVFFAAVVIIGLEIFSPGLIGQLAANISKTISDIIASNSPQATPSASATLTASENWKPTIEAFNGYKMARVPAGCFMMGSDQQKYPDALSDETPSHTVCLTKSYLISVYEITNKSFQAFVDAGGYSNPLFWLPEGWEWRAANNITAPMIATDIQFLGAEKPRIGISWYEADAYARWFGGRLPTEAEWEYAARGNAISIYPWGDSFEKYHANIDQEPVQGPHLGHPANIGEYPKDVSWVGAYDMVGNISEWVNDWYSTHSYQGSVKDDPLGVEEGNEKVIRGGNWDSTPSNARITYRQRLNPEKRDNTVGFRVVVSGGK